MSKKESHYSKTGLVFEELEPRLLLSADPLAVVTDATVATVQEHLLEHDEDQTALVQTQVEHASTSVRNELVIIDSRAPNYQQLHNDLIKAQQQGRNIHVVVLDAHRDGVEQINAALESHNKLDAVHIVSHGEDGQLLLGATQFNQTTLRDRTTDISAWKDRFTDSADLLIYGCNLAGTEHGQSLVDSLSRLTATDVAASDDLTGSKLLGGDWDLEYSVGEVETRTVFSHDLQQHWQGTLAAQTETVQDDMSSNDFAGNSGSQNWTGDWVEAGEADGAAAGAVSVQSGELVISENSTTARRVEREADLSGATSATLSFDYKRNTPESGGLISLEVSGDGGSNWDTLMSYDLSQADGSFVSEAFDISAYIAVDTQIRFSSSGADTLANMHIDNVQITYGDMANNDSYNVNEDGTLTSNDAWYDSNWQFRRTLSFDNLAQTQDLADFPVLIALDNTRIDYNNTQDNGEDLRFTDGDGSLLAHEIESWNETGTSYVWVKVSQIDASSNVDYIYMYYGNAAIADGQNAAAVWSEGYRAVYHLDEDPGVAGTVVDSMGNNDAVNAASSDAAGHIANAQDFDSASNEYINLGQNRDWINNASASTLSLWMNADTTSGIGDMLGVTINGAIDTGSSRIALVRNGSNVQVIARSDDSSSDTVSVVTSTSPLLAGQWHQVVGTVDYASDTNNIKIYVDGNLEGTFSHDFNLNNIPNTNSTNAAIGTDEDGGSPYFDGRLDEARIANQLRSADWISAQYDSMTDNFVTVGYEQSVAGVLGNDIDLQGDTLTINTTPAVGPSNGALVLNANGSFVYTPNVDFNGRDYFVYEATESGTGNTAQATVFITVNAVNDAPLATNLSAAETYTEDAPLDLIDIVVSDVDSTNVTVTLTLSDLAAGSLNTATSGSVTSTFSTGVWTASGAVDDVNTLLGGLVFTPALNYNSNFTITTSVDDGVEPATTGSKVMTGVPVGDAHSAVNDAYTIDEESSLADASTWNLAGWSTRQVLTFDNSAQTENLSDFPVLVALNSSRIDYSNTQDQGQDIRFVDSDGTVLAHEIEEWNEAGTSYVWVSIPQIDGSSNTDYIYMYYGNAGAADGQANVWASNYQAVYHLDESGPVLTDATANAFDGSNIGSTDITGLFGDAQNFNGSTQYVDLGTNRPFLNGASAVSLSAWIRPDTLSGSGDIVSVGANNATNPEASRAAINRVGDQLQVVARADDTAFGDVVNISTTTNPLTAGQWHYVVAVIDYANDSVKVYVNGVEQTMSGPASFTNTATPNTDSIAAAIGSNEQGINSFFDGRIDEVRIADAGRSADWIAAQYQSMTGGFVSFDARELVATSILANDDNPDNDTLTVTNLDTSATLGLVAMNADGSFSYDPNGKFEYLKVGETATDTFTYTANDGSSDSNVATVTITINGVNDTPEASDDPLASDNYLTSLGPTGYWRFGEAAGTTASDQTGLNNGTYNGPVLGQTGALAADANTALQFDGIDDYVSYAHDPAYMLDNGTVQLWFNTADVNQRADLFSKDALGFGSGGHVSIYLDGGGDIEVRLQSATTDHIVNSSTPLVNGQWHHLAFTFGANGMALYIDGKLQDSDTYTGGLGTTSGGVGNSEPFAIGASTQTSALGSVTPLQDYYTGFIDEFALFATALSAEQIQNLYSGGLQDYTMLENNTLNIAASEGVLINDYDVDGDSLNAVLVSGPSYAASFTLNPDGSFSYTPLTNFNGTDSFRYMASDGIASSNVATATITIGGVNHAPVNTVPGPQTVLEDTQTAITGISVADPDSGPFNITTQLSVVTGVLDVSLAGSATISAGANGTSMLIISGTVTDVNATLASLQYTGGLNVNGVAADTLTLVTNDLGNTGTGGVQSDTDNIQINITAVNDVPVAIANLVSTTEDTPYNFTAADFTFSDVEGDSLATVTITNLSLFGGTLTYSGGTPVNNGDTLTAAQLNTLIYTPAANANGRPLAAFDFSVNDAGSGVVSAQMGIDVSAVNDPPFARDDRIGLVFDGVDDFVRIGDYLGLNVSTQMTMEAWIKPTGLGSGSKIIINKEGEYELGITADTGEIKWAFDNTDPDWNWHDTGYFAQAGEWTHIAVSYNNGVVQTYANGVLVETYNGSGAITDNYTGFNELQIGGRENTTTQRFNGEIDEVRIWNTNRAQVDIQSGMTSVLTGSEANLIGNWRFDEGSGITVQDQSVFGHHGSLADGVTVSEMPAWQGYVVSEDNTLNVSAVNGVLANDFDIDGDTLTAVLVTGPANASAFSLNPDGSFMYTPNTNFYGIDSFTYRANDGSADSNIATVSIRVEPVNDLPVATANTVSTTEDNAYAFSASDFTFSDVDGDGLVSATITNLALSGGTLTYNGGTAVNSGDTLTAAQLDTLIYSPPLNTNGTPLATFDFSVNDAGTGVIAAQMAINVIAVNDVPVATSTAVITTEDNAFIFTAADFAYTDTEGDALVSATITNLSLAGGALTHSGAITVNNGNTLTAAQLDTLVYTPALNSNGIPLATFDFSVNDAGTGVIAAQMDIDVTPVNDVPVATANIVSTIENNAYIFTAVDFTFNDVEGDSLLSANIINLSLVGGTLTHSGGTVVNNGDTLTAVELDTLVYTPPINTIASPLASFDFSVNDAGAGVVTARIYINVTAVNNVPVATSNVVITTEDNAFIFTAADFTYTDTEGDALVSATITNLSLAGGTLTHSGGITVNDGDTLTAAQLDTLIYLSAPNANGIPLASFDFTVSDSDAGVASAQMSINVTAQPDPAVIAGMNTGIVIEDDDPDMDNLLEVSGSLTIVDPDAGEAQFNAGVFGGAYGVITLNAAGGWDYAANTAQPAIQGLAAGATLTDTITVSSVDGTTHSIIITIIGTNDTPATSGISDFAVDEDAAATNIDLNASFDDADNLDSQLTYSIAGNSNIGLFTSTGIDAVTGRLTLDYAADMNGSAQIAIRASDPSGLSVDTLFTVTVNPVNDNPVLQTNTGMMATTTAPAAISNSELNVTDIDNVETELVYTITALPSNGELLINGVAMAVNDTFTQADIDNNRVAYQSTTAVAADQFGFTVSDSSGGSLTNNTFNIVIQLSPVDNDNTETGATVNDDEQEEEARQQEATETEAPVHTESAGGYGDGFEPIGSTSVPPPPVLSIDPVPQPKPPQQIEPVEIEQAAAEVEDHTVSTFSAVQVKSMNALWSAIDTMKQDMSDAAEKQTSRIEIKVAAAETTGVVLTAGVVAWILRSGALFSSLISTIPLWRGYDPLPILAYKDDEDDEKEEIIDENKIPTSLEDLTKLKKHMKQKAQSGTDVDVDSMFGDSAARE